MFQKGIKSARILPLADVGIRAWPEQNFLFGILSGSEDGRKWIYNHFIQMRGSHYIGYQWDAKDASMTFYPYAIHYLSPNMFDLCPFVEKNMIPKSLILGIFRSFHEFVIHAIDGGYYISSFLDQFFREDMRGHYGFHHPTFIHGYDGGERIVYIADNFERGKYGTKKISYDQLDRAFRLVPDDMWKYGVYLYRVTSAQYSFVPGYVKEQLMDYIASGNGICYLNRTVCPESFHDGSDYLNEVFFGVQCYDLLDHCFQAVIRQDDTYPSKDWRSLVQLCDHKYLMRRRYQYMMENGYAAEDDVLLKDLEELEKECLIAQNMYIKYTVTDDIKIIERLRERIRKIRQMDIIVTENFIKRIL